MVLALNLDTLLIQVVVNIIIMALFFGYLAEYLLEKRTPSLLTLFGL